MKKWIDIFSNDELKEGKDYSFLYFGGTNLASFTALDDIDENLINILSTSRKAYLITDSDCSSQQKRDSDAFKAYLTSMLERLKAANGVNCGLDSSLEDYVKVWISEGREIENYICKDLLYGVLTKKGFKREAIGQKEKRKELEMRITQASNFNFGKFDSFDQAIASCYQYQDGSQLDESAIKNIASSYASKKVQIAKAIVDNLNKTHCSAFDLENRMKDLVEFIGR